jgi:hypothetical protein
VTAVTHSQEYTQHQGFSSRELDSTQREDNMSELDELTNDELFALVQANLYEDSAPCPNTDSHYISEEYGLYFQVRCRVEHHDTVMLDKAGYELLIQNANDNGLVPLYICSTPVGIWEFNLALVKPTLDKTMAYLAIDKGKPILQWYPDYRSEDEYIYSALESEEENMYIDPAEVDINMELEEWELET